MISSSIVGVPISVKRRINVVSGGEGPASRRTSSGAVTTSMIAGRQGNFIVLQKSLSTRGGSGGATVM
jgi:hypothetical protein